MLPPRPFREMAPMSDVAAPPRIIDLPLEPATAEALAPFGRILGRAAGARPIAVDFYKGRVLMQHPVAFNSEHPIDVTLATVDQRPPEVRYMERHFQHTQTFIPLGGKPFVAVMAPPSDGELPELDQVRAFLFAGDAGFTMHIGTWHEFPLALEPTTDLIVLLSTQTGYDLHKRDAVTEEASGPDLDKKDISRRLGTLIRFQAPAS